MNDRGIEEKIWGLLELGVEGSYWDFKREWPNNSDLLHDIICLANNLENQDAYIIVGVNDEKLVCGVPDKDRKNQQNVIDFLKDKKFAGDIRPTVYVRTLNLDKEIDVIIIKNSTSVPYYLVENTLGLYMGNIYTRIGDTNTPKISTADIDKAEHLWRKRFGLLSQPLEQMKQKLEVKENWKYTFDEETGDLVYHNVFSPEFTIRIKENYEDLTPEFYAYYQSNERSSYQNLLLLYHTTVLSKMQIVSLDSGRYSTPCPVWAFVHSKECGSKPCYSYKYILRDSLEYKVQNFLFDAENAEQVAAKQYYDKIVLYFDDKNEQENFNRKLEYNPEILSPYLDHGNKIKVYTGDANLDKVYSKMISISLALKKLQSEFMV